MSERQDDDELLARARDLKNRVDNADPDRDTQPRLQPIWDKFATLLQLINSVLRPIGAVLGWAWRMVVRWIRWAAYVPASTGSSAEPEFSWTRLLRNSLLTITAPLLLHIILSALYYYVTYFEETVYVTGKQEIVTGELYQFGGCTSLPCSTESDNGKFYLIESSLYFPVMYYPEENVFANIPQQDAACSVEGYGVYFRTLRWIYKSLQLYQHVVDVSCRPYTEEEIRRAVEHGEIVDDKAAE